MVITSPPYNLAGLQGRTKKVGKTDMWSNRNIEYDGSPQGDFMDEQEYQDRQVEVLNEIYRLLTPDGSLFYNHQVRYKDHKAVHPLQWISRSKLQLVQEIIWDRNGGMNKYPVRYIPSTQRIYWLTRGEAKPRFMRPENLKFDKEVWTIPPRPEPLHPAPFPDDVPENIIRCIPGNDVVVLDPYNGIGHTTAMAKRWGKKYIGIDRSKKYCWLAERRLEATVPMQQAIIDHWK